MTCAARTTKDDRPEEHTRGGRGTKEGDHANRMEATFQRAACLPLGLGVRGTGLAALPGLPRGRVHLLVTTKYHQEAVK